MLNQFIRPQMAHIFTNHWKTVPAFEDTDMYAKSANNAQNRIAASGRPRLVVRPKILGAFFESARPYRARDAVYKSDVLADQAEVRIAAFITEGSPFIPAVLIAITNGDRAPVDVVDLRDALFDGTNKPMTNVPPM